MLKELQNASAVKFLLYSSFGFLFQKVVNISVVILPYVFGIIVILAIIFAFTRLKIIFTILILFAFGILTAYRTQNLDFSYNGDFPPEINGLFNGKVLKAIKEKEQTSRFIIEGNILISGFNEIKHSRLHYTLINSKKTNLKIYEGNKIYAKIKFRLPNEATLPGEFSEKSYYRSIDVDYTAFSFANEVAIIDTATSQSLKREMFLSISKKIDLMYSGLTSCIVKAIILGDQTSIPQEIRQNFSLSGTAHILSVSGLHVGIIAVIIFWMFSFIKNNWLKFIIFSITLWGYAFLVDMQPAVVRAAFMIMLFMFAKVVQRKPNPLNIIAITILLISIINPGTLYNAGFQMSIASIIGIVLLYSHIQKFLQNILKLNTDKYFQKVISSSLAMTFSATIVVSPIVAYYFQTFSVISPLANLITIPIMVLAQSYAIIAILMSYIYFPISQIFAVVSQLCIELSEIITEFSVKLPGAYLLGKNVMIISILISMILLVILTSKHYKQLLFRFVICTFASLFVIVYINFSNKHNEIQSYNRPTSKYIEFIKNDISFIKEEQDQESRGYDYGLLTYLSKKTNLSKVYYNGPTGDVLVKKIKNPSIHFVKIKDSELNYINSVLNPK